MLVGPTGVGKSSLVMQMALSWGAGRPCFGLTPATTMRTLIVQAENDEGDMAEMRDGVMYGLKLPIGLARMAWENVFIINEDSRTRDGFVRVLDGILRESPFDLLVIDPLLAYLGGDASEQRDVSGFLRNMLNPLLKRHRIGLLLVHHVNKPPSNGTQKPDWQASDFAYLGSGSAEFANWARAILAIRSLGSETVYELRACKRGRRLPWCDSFGRHTSQQDIAYHRDGNTICWETPSKEALQQARPVTAESIVQDIVDWIAAGTADMKTIREAVQDLTGCSRHKAHDSIYQAVEMGAIRIQDGVDRREKLLVLTGKISPRFDAGNQNRSRRGNDGNDRPS